MFLTSYDRSVIFSDNILYDSRLRNRRFILNTSLTIFYTYRFIYNTFKIEKLIFPSFSNYLKIITILLII